MKLSEEMVDLLSNQPFCFNDLLISTECKKKEVINLIEKSTYMDKAQFKIPNFRYEFLKWFYFFQTLFNFLRKSFSTLDNDIIIRKGGCSTATKHPLVYHFNFPKRYTSALWARSWLELQLENTWFMSLAAE